jgi:hypothetical protein
MIAMPEPMNYVTEQEGVSIYRTEDGAVIRVRLVLMAVVPTGKFDDRGFPLHELRFQQLVDVTWPDHIAEEAAARAAKIGRGLAT